MQQLEVASREEGIIRRFSLLAEHAVTLLAYADAAGHLRYMSPRGLDFLGRTPLEGRGAPLARLFCGDDQDRVQRAVEQVLADAIAVTFEARVERTFGNPAWAQVRLARLALNDGVHEVQLTATDITPWKEGQSRLEHLAMHDPLTGLANRALCLDRVGQAIVQGKRRGSGFCVMLLDLDGFKKVNDSLGHGTGDELLQEAARRLTATLRELDTVARMGGDEFVLVLPETSEPRMLEMIANRVLDALGRPYFIAEHELYLSASIGLAVWPEHGSDVQVLMQHADIAMYRAKDQGKGGHCIFSPQLVEKGAYRLRLEAAMHEGIRNGEFSLHYQPIVNPHTRRPYAVEALMRWERPGEASMSPAEFIPLAEANGLITLLGAWALRTACHQAVCWHAEGLPGICVSVNVSPRQFRQSDFARVVRQALAQSGLEPARLILEITEGVLMHDPAQAELVLLELTALGIKVSVDDFGTGYSSLGYLKRFPLSTLKIDRSFVKDLPHNANDVAIVGAVLGLARELKLNVVAEGVETEAQLRMLSERGCTYVQGYLTGKPMPAAKLHAALVFPAAEAA